MIFHHSDVVYMLMHFLSSVALGPILLLQGLYVRKTVQLLPEPAGARRGVSGKGPALKLLILSDSAAVGVGVDTQDRALLGNLVKLLDGEFEVHYTLLGKTGYSSKDCLARLNAIEGEEFDVVLTSLGVNDVTSGCRASTFIKTQASITAVLKAKFSAKQILLSGLPPVSEFPALPQPLRWYIGAQAQRFDRCVRKLAQKNGLDFIEFKFDGDISVMASDGFHPGEAVYCEWARLAAEKVFRRVSNQAD